MKLLNSTFWKKTFLGLTLLISLISTNLVLAQSAITAPPPIIPTGTNITPVLPYNKAQDTQSNYLNNRLLPGIAASIVGLTGAVSLVVMVVAGIFLLTSYGSPERAGAAKKAITYAIVGLVISGLSYGIVAIVASINLSN